MCTLRDQPISTQKSVRIGVLLPSCARAQVMSMIDAYSLGKQASHAEVVKGISVGGSVCARSLDQCFEANCKVEEI